ncbi:uncharacterized protein PHACADRAFT_255900 [Phanerochaete carnosa HHB-10118-sp]|uniref:CRA domain-containing protein n=1 Tax=Phanerochaete carnosa (strain HHB-10118-sp) TaxID=650164 RepID=K5UYX7_PHACS|nr:uncharacterized protein PHACADRAFT_255900 [Phanerochaete carnosa HHB-10118-sp]EKM55341.1 hypothetical protein PHACADRAFT_255900 [Phanerochaete carnosa HHB-10118-sp]
MKRWTPPSKDKPTVQSKRFFSPTPDDLRSLVFDYLCHGAYTSTARAFVHDSAVKHVDSDGDELMSVGEASHRDALVDTMEDKLTQAELRRDIRIHILSGRVDDAIRLLNTHFPSVLDPGSLAVSSSTDAASFPYIPSKSVDPLHLLLNIRILDFTESSRTVPLPYHHPGAKVPLSPPPIPAPAERGPDEEFSEQQLLQLHKAQRLYSEASSLPKASDRALYLKELSQVTALLAYTVPENSIMAPFLAQDRREAVADQIESAILHRTNQRAVSCIELGARHATTTWSILHGQEISLPPSSKWPPGVKLPLSSNNSVGKSESSAEAGKKSQERQGPERAPLFDLLEFLDTKS